MKFFVETIGCQQNEYDASRLANFLKSAGFEETDDNEAEAIFILACAVRQMAVDRIYGRARNWISAGKKVYITSCLTPDDKKKLEEKGVVYFKDLEELAKHLNLKNKNFKVASETCYVPIMSGCNNFCSYCIVPFTRGREKSRPVNEVIQEIRDTIKAGKKEIVLLGQNVNSYQYGFPQLLKQANDLAGDFEISFMSNHPKDMTDDVIEVIATLPKVKKEIHLPLQSGSDKVLKDMNRPYTSEQYLKLVAKLKTQIPNLKLTTDIVVGYPTETEDDFQRTVKICKKVGYSLAYVNKYSPRKGTASSRLTDSISWVEKQRRWKVLDELINKQKQVSK